MSSSIDARAEVRRARRIVVKVGSGVLTHEGRVRTRVFGDLARQLSALCDQGREVVLVSSGAIAMGSRALGWSHPGRSIPEKQAAAAVGQIRLCEIYQKRFARHGRLIGQVLVTRSGLADRERFLNARHTLLELLRLGVVPVVNENDTVATEEIRFGDNDTLGALVTNLIEADCLVILTDQAGLYTADPRRDPAATLVQQARAGDPALEGMAGGVGSAVGRGGMITKILAAKRASRSGAHTIIASGHEPEVLIRLARGEAIGTQLRAESVPMAARKQWLADQLQIRGRLILDAGAVRVLREQGKSLLPIGVHDTQGEFERGELVACLGPDGTEVARGLANYSSSETRKILRTPSAEIESRLGYVDEPELIHRDNLILL